MPAEIAGRDHAVVPALERQLIRGIAPAESDEGSGHITTVPDHVDEPRIGNDFQNLRHHLTVDGMRVHPSGGPVMAEHGPIEVSEEPSDGIDIALVVLESADELPCDALVSASFEVQYEAQLRIPGCEGEPGSQVVQQALSPSLEVLSMVPRERDDPQFQVGRHEYPRLEPG